MQPQPQKKVARAYRVEGSIVLYRLAARSPSIAERPLLRSEPWWSMVFEAPLFLRTLLRLVFLVPIDIRVHRWHCASQSHPSYPDAHLSMAEEATSLVWIAVKNSLTTTRPDNW